MYAKVKGIAMTLVILAQVALAPISAVSAQTTETAPTSVVGTTGMNSAATAEPITSAPTISESAATETAPATSAPADTTSKTTDTVKIDESAKQSVINAPTENKSATSSSTKPVAATATPPVAPATKTSALAGQVHGEIIFDDPSQQNSLALSRPAVLYAKVAVDAATSGNHNFVDGSTTIALPREFFVAPEESDLTSAGGSLNGVALSEDDENYYITFNMKTIVSGGQSAFPFSVRLLDPNDGSKKAVVTQTISDSAGVLLDTTSQPIQVTTTDRNSYVSSASVTVKSTELQDNKLISDRGVMMSNSSPSWGTDVRPTEYAVTIPSSVVVDPAALANLGWTYDAQTRTAKISLAAQQTIPGLLVTIPAGTNVSARPQFDSVLTYQTGEELTTRTGYITITKETVTPFSPATSTSTYFGTSGSSWNKDISMAEAGDVSRAITKFNVKSIPQDADDVILDSVSQKYSGDSRTSLRRIGFRLEGSLMPGMYHNKVIGILGDKEVVLATNISTSNVAIPAALQDDYSEIKLVFDEPVVLSRQNLTAALCVYSELPEAALKEFASAKAASTLQLTTQSLPAYENYSNYSTSDYIKYTKTTAGISASSANILDYTNLFQGLVATSTLSISTTDMAGLDLAAENARVITLVPSGISYVAGDEATTNLKNVTVEDNYKDTGMTAIIGTPTISLNKNGTYVFRTQLTANQALRLGMKYQVRSYFYFTNNDGQSNYDLTSPSFGKSFNTVNYSTADPFAPLIFADTDNPKAGLARSATFQYNPPRELLTSAAVKKAASTTYTTGLGNTSDAGDDVDYRLNLFNNGLDDVRTIGLVNVIPRAGDRNGSQFDVHLTGLAKITMPASNARDYANAFDIYYATTNPAQAQADYQAADWTTTPADLSKVTMIKAVLKSGQSFHSGDEVNVDYPAQLSSDLSVPDGKISYNLFETTLDQGNNFISAPAATASINYRTSSATVTKVSAADPQLTLFGATFELFDYDSDTRINPDTTYRTNDQGQVSVNDLKPGHYYLHETAAPVGYLLPTDTAAEKGRNQFTITRNQSTAAALTIANTPAQSLLIRKIDRYTQAPLAGAHFKVVDDQQQVVQADLMTNAQGEAAAFALPAGDYQLIETKAPSGYLLDATPQAVTISEAGALVTAVVADTPLVGTLHLIDHVAGQPDQRLVGSKFILTQVTTGLALGDARELVTDAQGEATLSDLLQGHYRLTQEAVASGYLLDKTVYEFDIDAQHQLVDLVVTNQRQPVAPTPGPDPTPNPNPDPTPAPQPLPQPLPTPQLPKTSGTAAKNKSQQATLPATNERQQHDQVIGWLLLLLLGLPLIYRESKAKD